MFKIVHLLTGAAALLLSLIPSLRGEAVPFLQQPDAIYLALFGLLNLTLAPVLPQHYRGARSYLQQAASALLVLAVILQAVTLLAARRSALHEAHHEVMECLGEMIWSSQRSGLPPDGPAYIDAVRRRATAG